MKITSVEPILVAIPFEHGAPKPSRQSSGIWETQDILFVRVDTDAGITGWGEAFSIGGATLTRAAVRDLLAPLALGQEIDGSLALAHEMARRLYSIARGGPVAFALSAIDTALWDIVGKAKGRPVWELLGGTRKSRIPAYASLHRLSEPAHVRRVCRMAVERGYRQIKLHEHSVEAVAAAREAVGPNIALMIDTNCFWQSVEAAKAACDAFAPYDIMWLEEPLYPADEYDALARLRREGGLPIAAGENLGNVNDARWMIDADAVDIVQPSVAKIGGISAAWRVLAYAAQHGARGVPHSPFVGPALIATIHMVAALSHQVSCEHRFCDLAASAVGDGVLVKDGYLTVPEGPGLGFEVDQTVVQRYRVS